MGEDSGNNDESSVGRSTESSLPLDSQEKPNNPATERKVSFFNFFVSPSDPTYSTQVVLRTPYREANFIDFFASPNKQSPSSSSDILVSSDESSTTQKRKTLPRDNAAGSKKRRYETVSTQLSLGRDPCKMEKELTQSDLGEQSRLMLDRSWVINCLLPFLGSEMIDKVNNGGIKVGVFDEDSGSIHDLTFKLWPLSKAYVLVGKWNKEFVKRRELKLEDKVGICWDPWTSRFQFQVLRRA